MGEVLAGHVGLIGIPIEGTAADNFQHQPVFAGLAKNVDACYRKNITLALKPDGKWLRVCSLLGEMTLEHDDVFEEENA